MNPGETAPRQTDSKMRWINRITLAGAAALLILSLWPGYAHGWMPCLALPSIAILGLIWIIIVIRAASAKRPSIPWREIVIAPTLVCCTYVALRYYIPRRASFRAH